MATFTGQLISATYDAIIKTVDNDPIGATAKLLTDGLGNNTPLYVSTTQIGIGITPTEALHVSGNALITGSITIDTNATISGNLSWGSLTDTGESITITKFVDAADGIANNNNDTSIPTSAAVKSLVDSSITAQDLDFSGDNGGTGSVDLDSQVFSIVGTANEIDTVASGQQLQIGLPNSITISGTFFATEFQGALAGTINSGTTAVTQSAGNNSTKVATTAYADAAASAVPIGDYLPLAGGTMIGNTSHNDNIMSIYGTGSDLQIYHDGVDSFIKELGVGALKITSNHTLFYNVGYVKLLAEFDDIGVKLYYDNVKKFETTSTGISVSGTSSTFAGNVSLIASSAVNLRVTDGTQNIYVGSSGSTRFGLSGGASIIQSTGAAFGIGTQDGNSLVLGANNTAVLTLDTSSNSTFAGTISVASGTISVLAGNNMTLAGTASHGGICFATNSILPATAAATNDNVFDIGATTERFKDGYFGGTVTANNFVGGSGAYLPLAGGTMTGVTQFNDHTQHGDQVKSKFGAGNDLEIYHNGTNSVIDNNTNNLLISTASQTIISSDATDNQLTLGQTTGNWFAKATNSNTLVIGSESNGTNNITLDTSNGGSATFAGDVIQSSASKSLKYWRRLWTDANNDWGLNNNAGTGVISVSGMGTPSTSTTTFAGDLTVTGSITGGSGGSFLPLSGGTMTGNITFNNSVRELKWNHTSGESGSRAYGFIGEQGAYGRFALRSSNAADNTLDTDVLYFDNDLSATFAGKVLINSSNASQFIINNASGGGNAKKIAFDMGAGDIFKIKSLNDNDTVRIDNIITANVINGNVGIGTDSPTVKLDVRTDDGVLIKGASGSTNGKLSFLPASGGRQYDFRNDGSNFVIQDASAGTNRMYFHYNGNVGIGTTSPSRKLTIGNGNGFVNNQLSLLDGAGTERATISVETTSANDLLIAATSNLRFFTGSTIGNTTTLPTNEKLRITSGGDVIITSGYTDQNGVRTFRDGGVMTNGTAYNIDITVDDDTGTGTVHHITAMMTHYSTNYGCVLDCYAYTRGTGVNAQTDLLNQSNAEAGGWTVTKPNNTTLRLTKSAGNYTGAGNYQVVVVTSTP